jgi:hypothetical protein
MKVTSMSHELVLALPLFVGDNLKEFVVVVDRGASTSDNPHWERYVVARMRSLDDSEWLYSLKYTVDRDHALRWAYRSVEIGPV